MAEKTEPAPATVPTLMLYGVCGSDWYDEGYTARDVAAWLNENAAAEAIEIRINSPGGYVDEGLAIFNLLAGFTAKKTVRVDGIAASMASVIMLVGEQRIMGEGSLVMIHNPAGISYGEAADHRRAADVLDVMARQMVRLYGSRTGQEAGQLQAWMDAETWFEASQALANGFATEVLGSTGEEALARVPLDFLGLKTLPARLVQARERHRGLIPQPKAKAGHKPGPATPITDPQSLAAAPGREGQAAPGAAAEVNKERPMTVVDASAQKTADQIKAELDTTKTELDRVKAENAEHKRVAEINRLCGQARMTDKAQSFIDNKAATVDEVRAQLFDAMANRQQQEQPGRQGSVIRVSGGLDAGEKFVLGAQARIIQMAGLATVLSQAAKLRGEKLDLDPGEFRSMSLLRLAEEALENSGVNTRRMDKNLLASTALTMRPKGVAITQGTSDFPTVLENVMHKVVQAAYAVTADTWTRFCHKGSVTDFRPHNRYRMGSFGTLDLVGESGEFLYKAIPDGEKSSITAKTKGNRINLSRQAIVNDDMGAFNQLAVWLGRAAKLSIEVDIYALLALNSGLGPNLADGLSLFHASHNNIGTGAALSMAAVESDRQVMAKQTSVGGNEILDLRPAVWVGPVSSGGTMRTINEAQYDPDTPNRLQKPNMVRGLYKDIVDTARLTGTRTYSFADASSAPVLEVAFLDGVEEPFVDNQDGWGVDGVEFKVRHDYAVAGIDYRGAVTNAGA